MNLFRPPLGSAMTYPNTKKIFDRLARTTGHACRPHVLRHSAATRWLRRRLPPRRVARAPANRKHTPAGDPRGASRLRMYPYAAALWTHSTYQR